MLVRLPDIAIRDPVGEVQCADLPLLRQGSAGFAVPTDAPVSLCLVVVHAARASPCLREPTSRTIPV